MSRKRYPMPGLSVGLRCQLDVIVKEKAMSLQHPLNNFDGLRLIAAVAVLVGHAWPLTGRSDAPAIAGLLVSHLAVYVFFSISGYLITVSWNSSPRVASYLRRRAARIFPALLAVLLTTVLVIGPISTVLPIGRYFATPETWEYLAAGMLLAPRYTLPGVFQANPSSAVNGSLWSLGPEFISYLLVIVVGLLALAFPEKWRAASATLVFAAFGIMLAVAYWTVPIEAIQDSAPAMVFFVVGSSIARFAVGARLPLWPVIPLILMWILVSAISDAATVYAAWLAVPYASIAVGQRSWPVLSKLGRYGDFSYGIYLWSFPLQQVVWLIAPAIPLLPNICLVLVATSAAAVVSWFLIERPAIRWARRTAGSKALKAPLHETIATVVR
ncbi:acyltransferase [uncultured Schumannella sp.]|uniref:acyltransferase family protein n=1 Tax=uncultured Schumannella sp. TaxID=1195956 RepID=UPI0025FE5AC3|nr:acyltransferase [uncultured Schumannella sp.]